MFALAPAPSQAPRIVGKKLKGQTINIAWENSQPLPDEAAIDGYKVSLRSSPPWKRFSPSSRLTFRPPLSRVCVCPGLVQEAGPFPRHPVHHQQAVHRPPPTIGGQLRSGGAGPHRGGRRRRGSDTNHR